MLFNQPYVIVNEHKIVKLDQIPIFKFFELGSCIYMKTSVGPSMSEVITLIGNPKLENNSNEAVRISTVKLLMPNCSDVYELEEEKTSNIIKFKRIRDSSGINKINEDFLFLNGCPAGQTYILVNHFEVIKENIKRYDVFMKSGNEPKVISPGDTYCYAVNLRTNEVVDQPGGYRIHPVNLNKDGFFVL